MQNQPHIALVGNPNCGKSSLFNALTGLNQKVGNFPGVTIDKKTGIAKLPNGKEVNILDLPGTYSLYPKSGDEQVTYDALLDTTNKEKPAVIIVIVDASNLKRNLLFCSQIIDLQIPVIVALSMLDLATKKGVKIDVQTLSAELGVPVLAINPRKNKGITEIKKQIQTTLENIAQYQAKPSVDNVAFAPVLISNIQQYFPNLSAYACLHIASEIDTVHFVSTAQKKEIKACMQDTNFNLTKIQASEVMQRYTHIKHIMQKCVVEENPMQKEWRTEKIDKIVLHPIWGNLLLLFVLFLVFQSVFWLAQFPMNWIDIGFSKFIASISSSLPNNMVGNALINGILPGISGILIFIPQIMILFGLITLLEDTGYMSRISFLTDRLMRSVGLNGRAVMPLISGLACAVPAIMSARTIENKKERLITILITPLMSCSARLPVYTILVALVIPPTKIWGIISLQGLVMMGLYLLGFVMALLVAKVLNYFISNKQGSIFLMELPVYRAPRWQNIGITMLEKAKLFIRDAGKIIMIISLVLWVLCSFGPTEKTNAIKQKYASSTSSQTVSTVSEKTEILENSYAGILGKAIEPAIRPLGFDWKIGIALIASFAAREVFVGTMATLYSIDANNTEIQPLQQKMQKATDSNGNKIYTLATGLSLMLFYVFAMQCMSTMAVVKRETKSWKYPIYQFIYMGILAYVFSFVVFHLFR